jgi:hypothetical protein
MVVLVYNVSSFIFQLVLHVYIRYVKTYKYNNRENDRQKWNVCFNQLFGGLSIPEFIKICHG